MATGYSGDYNMSQSLNKASVFSGKRNLSDSAHMDKISIMKPDARIGLSGPLVAL